MTIWAKTHVCQVSLSAPLAVTLYPMMISMTVVDRLLVSPAESNGPLGCFCKSQNSQFSSRLGENSLHSFRDSQANILAFKFICHWLLESAVCHMLS